MNFGRLWLNIGLCSLASFSLSSPMQAQSVMIDQPSLPIPTPPLIVAPNLQLDGSTNSKIIDGNQVVPIDRDALRGNNLYHSFSQFNVPNSGVTFGLGTSGIDGGRVTNIINRVSGTQPSLINGTIQSSVDFPRASVYLLNPNGIVFSANASLNVGASFYATTATAIGFSNGNILGSDKDSVSFSIATPNNVQFAVETPSPIINQANLTVRAGENITLAAGRIISTGTLNAANGSADVAAPPGNSTVLLRSPSAILGLEVRAGVLAPQWQGSASNLSQLAQLLTGSNNLEANRAVVNADGSLQLVNASAPLGLSTLLTPSGQLEINGRLEVRPGDIALSSVSAGESRILASRDLVLLVPNLQTARGLFLRAENRILLRDSIAKPAIVKAIGNLTFQGLNEIDILALNHPQTVISSGGLFALRSNGRVLGDAFFSSGGTFSVRTLPGVSGNFVSALAFEQDAGGTLQFLATAPPTIASLVPALSQYRQIIDVDARAVDGTKNNPSPKSESSPEPKESAPKESAPKESGPKESTPKASAEPATLAVQVGLGALSSLGKLAIASGSASNVADLLLQSGRILEAQQALDLSILEEIETYLGSSVTRKNQALPPDLITPAQKSLYQAFTNLQNRFTQAQSELKLPNLRSDRQVALEKISNQTKGELEKLLAQPEMALLAKAISEVNLRQLQQDLQSLAQPTVMIYPLIRSDRLELILIPPKGDPIRRTTRLDSKQLFAEISSFRRSLETVFDPALDPKVSAQKLYQWLIAPLEADLTKIGAKAILYAPNAQLRYVPLAALYDGDRWLVERFQINNITAASLQDFSAQIEKPKQILAAAVTKSSNLQVGDRQVTFEELPYAQQEIDNLSAIFPQNTSQLQDKSFSAKRMLSQAQSSTILHLATHAFFRPGKPEDSFILFGNNERQTLADVARWSIPNIDLIVLSACDTAAGQILGNGQEILGFGYLMQQSGARAAIASLWAVDDGGTQALMDIFYSLLKQPGMSKAEALRQTQIALITGKHSALGKDAARIQQNLTNRLPASVLDYLSHPYYWAPFILIGKGI
jgi:filamentous hemagglutinin family protein